MVCNETPMPSIKVACLAITTYVCTHEIIKFHFSFLFFVTDFMSSRSDGNR